MGFPSPAQDYVEDRISLDATFIAHPHTTYFMRAGLTHYREGIIKGALLICCMDGELKVKRYRSHPSPHLLNLESGMVEAIPDETNCDSSRPIFGVITYIINDARAGEFDDCPVM